jgi:nitric oxide reductase large subunit
MPDATVFDSTDKGTLRPNEDPLHKQGSTFKPMQLPQFGWEITLPEDVSPDDPITLFTIYYTPRIIDLIVEKTNTYLRKPQDDSTPCTRANAWYLTSRREIYIYLAIRIYMSLYIENEIADYWDTNNMTPEYPITKFLSRNRFQELHIYMRFYRNQE